VIAFSYDFAYGSNFPNIPPPLNLGVKVFVNIFSIEPTLDDNFPKIPDLSWQHPALGVTALSC